MEASNQQSLNAQILMDQYYDHALSTEIEKSFNDISQYDTSSEYISEVWSIA